MLSVVLRLDTVVSFGIISDKATYMSVGVVAGRSLINSTKSNGPKMLPCGTPEVTCDQVDATPLTTTLCVLSVR